MASHRKECCFAVCCPTRLDNAQIDREVFFYDPWKGIVKLFVEASWRLLEHHDTT